MLRFLYLSCDILAAVSAILSPVAIFHWLLRAIHVPLLEPYLEPLNHFFDPLNGLAGAILHPPAIHYNGQQIPTEQGVVACVLTAAFFLLNFASEYLKTTEQRQDVSRQAHLQRQHISRLREEQSRTRQRVITNRRYLVHANYDFTVCPAGGQLLDRGIPGQSGKVLEHFPDCMVIEFPTLQQAIQYCMDASQSILAYYATLRPVEPQPPFRIGIQTLDAEAPASEIIMETRRLVGFANPNSVIFTQNVKDVLDANGQSLAYHFQSIGMYVLEGRQQELFKLFNTQHRDTF